MGKQQKPKYNFTLDDALGGLDLSNDPTVQKVKAAQAVRASQDTLSSTSQLQPTVQFLQHDKEVYDQYLEPGRHGGTPEELDYQVAENQSTVKQMVNGLGRLLPLVATKFAGQVNAVKQAVQYASGDKDVFYDDEIANGIKSWEDDIKKAMPIYATKTYDDGSLLEQMGTAKFWADDIGDGVAFLGAQLLGTKGLGLGIQAVGKGAVFAGEAAGAANLLSKVPGAAKIANAIGNNYTAVTAGIVNAGFSGALQAQDTANQIKLGLEGKVNPNTGSEYTEQEIKAIAGDKAANTFNATFLAHILPGIWESKIFLGLNKAKLGDLREGIMGAVNRGEVTMESLLKGTGEAALLKNTAKSALKGIGQGALIEGVWEENIEQSIQKYDIQTGLNDKNVGVEDRGLSYAMGLLENFGTKEDAKAILMGALLGGPMGGVHSYKSAQSYNERMPSYIESLRSSDQLYNKDINSIYKTQPADVVDSEGKVVAKKGSLILSEDGNPIEDIDKLKNLTFQILNQKKLWDKQTVATLTGNTDMATLNENVALSAAVYRELATAMEDGDTEGALDFLKWRVKKQLQEQGDAEFKPEETEVATDAAAAVTSDGTPQGDIDAEQAATQARSASSQFNAKDKADISQAINQNLAKLDRFADAFKASDIQAKKLIKIGQSPERSAFNVVAQKGLFYESVKRESFDAMIEDRKNQLQDPLADIEGITEEINKITALKNDSIDKSKRYLNETDAVYDEWAGPQATYTNLLKEALETSDIKETDPEKRSTLERKRDTTLYRLNEIEATEGLGTDTGAPTFNQEIAQVPISDRGDKPVGARNQFFWKAGNDAAKSAELNTKINDYENNKTTLKDVLTYAKESISHLDTETSKRLNGLLTQERDKLASIEDQLSQTEEALYSEEDGELEYQGTNPEFSRLVEEKKDVQNNINDATWILTNKEAAAELDLINNSPENVERYLVREFALKHFDKGRYVLRNALDENGNVKEDYFDRTTVNNAIKDLTSMRNALQDRLNGGDLEGMKGVSYLVRDADAMLSKLYKVREQAELNKNNREGKQAAINRSEAETLISGLGFKNEAITNTGVFNAVDAILGGTLLRSINEIQGLTINHYEAVMALLHKIQTKGTQGQLGKIYTELAVARNASAAVIKDILGTKGNNGFIVKDFAKNPRQLFPSVWVNLSHKYAGEDYARMTNAKGTLFNTFAKNNDNAELTDKVDALPEDTKELGMPKAEFVRILAAYNQAVESEKLQNMLESNIKPIVQSELKSAAQETLAPTAQQDISIREGISWLNRSQKGTSPFKGWAFLRGIAGTGKTNVVLKWILNNSGIDKSDVMVTALTQTATEVAGKSTAVQATVFDTIERDGIPANIKLLVIDEYGTIGESRLTALEANIRELRKGGQDIKVLMLGDPTQITPRLQNNQDVNNIAFNKNAANIEIINPVTVVYRSDISAVNEASDLFQDNNRSVGEITVRADRALGIPLAKGVHVSSAASQIAETINANVKAEEETKSEPRTRAIIVGRVEDLAKYEGLPADVMTVYDAQSRTYDEVYVDIPQSIFQDVERFNTSMYTAASRAKQYSFLVYPNGENITDTSLVPEYANNIDKLKESKTAFIQAKTSELAMMDGLDNGQTIKQTVKATKNDVKNAGKSALDIEVEEKETEDEPEVVAEPVSSSDEADTQIDTEPEGEIDPETELPADASQSVPSVMGTRQAADNVDSEAYPALRDGLIGASQGNPVLYIYNKETSGENAVSIIAQDLQGNWVRIGKIFQEQINSDPRFADIKDKVGSMKPFFSSETDVLNGRRTGGNVFTADQLSQFAVREGKIGASQYLRFLYHSGLAQSANLAKDISQTFKEKFYHKSQSEKADKVTFKIFTDTDLTKGDYDGSFRPLPGIPYAIVGSDGVSYKGAMFVRLQPQRITSEDDQIVTLKRLADSVETIQNLTGIMMGTKGFSDLIRVFRHSLEIVQEQTPEGTVPKVKARTDYTRQEMIANAEEMFETEGRTGNPNPDLLKMVPDDKLQDAMDAVQNAAMQLYGRKSREGKYTKAEIEAMGEEYEAIPTNAKQKRNGEEVFYAQLKGVDKRQYRRIESLEIDNGVAQIAFDQIARANEFVGGTRIRVQQYTGKVDRKTSYKGKSLINSDGGSSKVYELLSLAARKITLPKMIASGDVEDNSLGFEAAKNEMRTKVDNSSMDPVLYLTQELNSLGDDAISGQVDKILLKKETPPVTLGTLQQIAGDINFDENGAHRTAERFQVTDSRGNTENKSTFIRKPLMLDKFNELGSDPIANSDELGRMVTTSFDGIAPTKIDIDFGDVVVTQTEKGQPMPVAPTTELHADVDNRIAEINEQLAKEKSPLAKRKLLKEKTELENSRGRMPYDSSADRPAPGKRINTEKALADLQRMIPGIDANNILFLNRSMMAQLSKPGENLLGLFDKGNIYLTTNEDGTVYDRVLRHEIMHKIYNEYLSDSEKRALRDELDPQSTMNGMDFDEHLADTFMSWQRNSDLGYIGPKTRNIFQRILEWFGFYSANKSAVKEIFQKVEDGFYTKPIGGTSDVRRAFSDISKDFGSVANYRFAVNTVHGMVKDSVMVDDLNVSPITMKEAKEFTKQKLLDKKNNLESIYKENIELIEELRRGNEEEQAEVAEVELENSDVAAQLSTLSSMFPTNTAGKINDKVFTQLWKDMYPNYNFREGERISSFEEYPEEYTEEDDLNDAQLAEESTASSLQDFTVQSDERNSEGKITENVKNFLSFIFRKDNTRVNPRYAYLECLRNLNGLISSEGDLKAQIREAAISNGIDLKGKSDGRLVIDHLLNLIDNATAADFVDNKGNHVELPREARFYGEDRFATSAQGSIATTDDPARGVVELVRQTGESTPAFIKRVEDTTGYPKQQLVGYFKQAQAQETMREVMSNFLSQREADPLIAEEAREGSVGQTSRVLRYFRAQMYGSERVVATDVENSIKANWLKIPATTWANFESEKDDNNKVNIILKALGINKDTKDMNLSLTADIAANLKAFHTVVGQAYKDGKPAVISKKATDEEGLEAEQESVQYMDVEYLLGNESSMINNITKVLSRNSADARPAKYVSVDGRSRYSFHNSNQAIETLQRVINATGKNIKKSTELPAHLRTAWAKLNIFVEGQVNQIHKIIDHDGMRKEWGEEFAKGYTDETNAENLARQFSYGFLNYSKANAAASDSSLKYIQFFYTISNRPRMLGAEVNVLKPGELNTAAHKMLDQYLSQPDHKNIANYSRYKTINMELLGDAIKSVAGPLNADIFQELQERQTLRDKVIAKFMENLNGLSKTVADRMVSERVIIGDNAGKLTTLMKERKRGYLDNTVETIPGQISQTRESLGYTAEQILPLVHQWVANNYINGYFMNQLPVGNFNYFKSAIDLVKRMSGVFAPGTKGLVSTNGEFFMKPKFRMAIMNDPKMYSDELSSVFKDHDTALFQEVKNNVGKANLLGQKQEKGFDLADAQGFMLPSRASNIIAGMGKAYNAGAIFKPAHYEVVDRGESGFAPVMIKYSSAVLSDELVQKFPKLLKLRDEMERMQVDELVFDSANKVGGPITDRSVPKMNEFGADIVTINEDAVVALSNENYRLQLNPKHDTFSDVSNPTQLGYFLNVMGKINPKAGAVNDPAATEVYTAIGNLIQHGLKKVTSGLTRSGKVDKRQIQKTLTGAGNERIAEMLKELDYNMPNIADKALIQIMNMFSKETVKIKFKGGKFVLQSAYGFEMIKKGSDRYNTLSEPQQKAHDENWSRYGEAERAKLEGQARSLKYGTDVKGRMFAEVLIDKNYAEKAKIGDFLLPDMMGYRIPSTELHSSIAIKVAGFYDSKGSNVIVAPPELVMQHGSDFDVDSLYVIGREMYDKDIEAIGFKAGTPVGYVWDTRINKYAFNKKNWDESFPKWYDKAGTNKQLIGQIDRLYEMYQRNIIVENFLDVISHPVNIQRMTEPISTQVITDALEELKLNTENTVDLSNPLDNLDVYNSNFQGAKLVGVFANGMKALAYMLKAGPNGSYPTIQIEDAGVTLGETVYNEFSEKVETGNIWQVLDALVNTAVDNVKDQKLYKINATNATGNMYVASQALGMPLKDTITFMLQPIALLHSKYSGKLETVKAELLAAYNAKAELKIEKYPDLVALASSVKSPSLKTLREFMNKDINDLSEKELLKQAALMRSFENLYNLGQDISTFSSSVGIVQTLPVMYEDIQKRADGWSKMGSVDPSGDFKTNEDFSFNIDNLFTAQPNIREAYKVFQSAKETAEISLTKHLPAVRAFVDEVVKESGVRLSFKQNVEDVKNELISYLVSSMYSDQNKSEAPYSYMYKNSPKIATGKQAWSQRFIDEIETYKKKVKGTDQANAFLSKVGIQNRYGLKTLTFSISSNSDYVDNMEMQEAFEQLPSEQMKQDFVKYAVMNYGLKFGVKNYSMFIPVQYLRPVDAHMKSIDKALRNNKIGDDGTVVEGELKNIKDNFMLRLAVNNADKLPFISSKTMKAIPTPGKTVIIQEPTGPKSIPALNGMDEYYYNRKYANPLVGDEGKRQFKKDAFPQFIKTSENIALMRVNDPDSDFVYYQRLGMKNWLGGYDASTEALKGGYDLDKFFGKGIIPVPVGDVQSDSFQVNNDYITQGSKVIVYGYSNESRDQGRIGIVSSVQTDLTDSAKKTIRINDITDQELNEGQTQFVERFTPIITRLRERFKIPMVVVPASEMPIQGVKGMIKDGTVYLNMDLMTWDTPFHEVAHPLIEAIKDRNAPWYKNLVKELHSTEQGQTIIEQVNRAYPELTVAERETEAMVTLLGDLAADNLNNTPTLKSLGLRLLRAIGDMLRTILTKAGVLGLDGLSRDEMASVTLNDLAQLLAVKDTNIQLDLTGYTNRNTQPFMSKPLEPTPTPEPESVMAKILSDANLIIDPAVDEEGNQADTYGITDVPGGVANSFIGRVSSLIGEFSLRKSDLKDRAGNPYANLTEAIVQREADAIFKGKQVEERVSVEGIEYNKAEFIDFKRAIYRQGQVKGDLIHALMQFQTAALNGDQAAMDTMKNKINQLENLSATEPGSYNWVIQKENFQAIMKNAGIVVDTKVPADNRDKVFSEISVANADMAVAGKIDTLVEKPDGRLKVLDYKTGNRFNNNNLNARIMNYGSQEFNIYDSALGRAKLQTMLYSVIIKANNPEALFEPPMVMHIPDEYRAKSQRNAHQVEVRDYLRMIEQFYRTEKPEAYKAMLEKSPKLFDPVEYGSTRNTSFTQDMIDDKTGMRDDEMLNKYEVELEQLVTGVSIRGNESDNYKGHWTVTELKKRDQLMLKISQARTTLGLPQGSTKDFEIRKFTQWLGTINDTHNPYIQAYSQIVNQARLKVYEEYGSVEAEFNSKLTKVLEEKIGKRTGVEKAFKPIDKQKLFENLINEEIQEDPTDGQRRVKRGLITEQDPGWNQLTEAEKDLVIYMREKMKGVFEDVMTKGPNAVVATRNGKARTKLDVYNDNIGAGFKWSSAFIPKVAITSSEVRWRAMNNGIEGTKQFLKHELAKRFSMFYEQHVEGDNQRQYGIPVKYLGNGSSVHNPDIHTSNLEVAFKAYMQHMINKKHYDTVYALGDSVKGFLELQQDSQGNYINKNAAEFVGYHMHKNLIGRLGTNEEEFWRKGFRIGVSSDGRDINFSPIKFMRTLNSVAAASALWLKIPSAAKNAGQAVWAVGKESMVNSLASTEWGGVSVDKQDLSAKNHARAYSLWMDYQKAGMLGKGDKHPVHVFMRSFRMYPEMTELGVHNRNMVADGGTAFNLNHLSFLYSYPESMTTAVTAMDAMMTMKVKSGPYAGESMWDVYSRNIVTDPVSGEGKYELPADFTRGKLRMGDGSLQELKGLNALEVQKLHRLVQRVKGGYRTEERSMIESTAIGEMFMLFRRWLPASIVQGFKSKQYDYSMGYLEKTANEDEYQWQARMTEGRWRTLAGVVAEYSGRGKKRGYQWADLSDLQRKNMIDASMTLSVFAVTSAIVAAAFGDSDDEDSVKKWASEMNMRIIEQWNFVAMAEAATSQPAAVKRVMELIEGMSGLGMATASMATGGDEDDVYNKRGELKGANKVLKNLPVASAFYDVEKFIENSDYWQSEE